VVVVVVVCGWGRFRWRSCDTPADRTEPNFLDRMERDLAADTAAWERRCKAVMQSV
jgi:alkylhydroperoxidase family enzyme